jgi:CMP-N,N'-diacetyllegionaminic acid synthase
MKVLYLLVARGGSKGIPAKNLSRIGPHSLIGYKALGARASRYCSKLIISTESEEIRNEAQKYGVEAPFARPAALAGDEATTESVILHAMDWFEQHGLLFDAVMLLEPTTPFTRPGDYDAAVELMIARSAAVVVGVREIEISSRFVGPLGPGGELTAIVDRMGSLTQLRRQDQAPEYTMNGALYLMTWDHMRRHGHRYADRTSTYGYPMEREYSIEIDHPLDLEWARFLVHRRVIETHYWDS